MRIGMYAVYQGKEYKAAKLGGQLYKIIAYGNNPGVGFRASEYDPRAFVKTVNRNDLGDVFLVKTYADFRGARLEIAGAKGDTVILATADETIAAGLGMEKIDRCDFRLEVNNGDVDRFVEEIERL